MCPLWPLCDLIIETCTIIVIIVLKGSNGC